MKLQRQRALLDCQTFSQFGPIFYAFRFFTMSFTLSSECNKEQNLRCADVSRTFLASETVFCENETFEARCAHDEVVHIVSARFGRMTLNRCAPNNHGHVGCHDDVTRYVSALCGARQMCSVEIYESALADVAGSCPSDIDSYLEVDYECRKGNHKTKMAAALPASCDRRRVNVKTKLSE